MTIKHSSVVVASIADFRISGREFVQEMEKCTPKLEVTQVIHINQSGHKSLN